MHIAFLSNEYPPLPSGGIGTSVQTLARALVAAGRRVTVLGWGRAAVFEDRGVTVRFLGVTGVPKLGWLLNRQRLQAELNRMVREEALAIVEAPDWCGPAAGLRLACPLVIRCNGSATYFADLLGTPVRPTVRWAEGQALRAAAGVVAVSRFTAERTQRLFRLRQPVGCIPNGIDLAHFAPVAAATEPDTILYFGTLVRKKGVLDLPAILRVVLVAHPRARLRIIGRDAPDRQSGAASTWALLRAGLSLAEADRVEYTGPQPYPQMQAAIAQAAVCLFPSYAEALPLAWLEAMACAKPLVAYDMGWAGEIIVPQETGYLVPAGDTAACAAALVGLLADPAAGARLGAAGRARVVAQFAAPQVAQQTLDWYTAVISAQQQTAGKA